MKKILITGASGFIGSFLVEEAMKNNYEVFAGVRKSSNTQYLNDPGVKLFELDYSDPVKMNRQLSEVGYFEYVIHNAAATRALKKVDFRTVNYQYTRNFIEALIQQDLIPEKFIYMSSLAAFGPGDPIQLNQIKNSGEAQPVSSYGKSKLASENYLKSLSNFPYIIIRPTAVYGPREKDLFSLFQLINMHLEFFMGRQKQHLSFIYVKDLARVVFQAIHSEVKNKGYFISDGNTYDSKSFGNMIKTHLDKKTLGIHFPGPLVKLIAMISESTKYFTQRQSLLNIEKIKELQAVNWKCDIQETIEDLNFKPEYSLSRGIGESIDWYKKNNWLK